MINSPDLECDEDPVFCDCSFHVNARRAERSHDNDPPRCNQCGREPPTHARHCPKAAPFGAAAAELAAQLMSERQDGVPAGENDPGWPEGTPEHVKHVVQPAFKLEMHGAEGDAMCCVFEVIRNGGTLVLTGPNSIISPNDRQFGASLEDARGELAANAIGNELGDCLVGLVREWRRLELLDQHQAEHDRAQS